MALTATCCPQGVYGYGPLDTGVMCVGIAPGSEELKTKRPFSGPSGNLLDAVLDACSWPRSRVFTTNLHHMFNNNPSLDAIQACGLRFNSEGSQFIKSSHAAGHKRVLVIALGKLVSEYLFGMPFGKMQGALLNSTDRFRQLGWIVPKDVTICGLPTFHPSGILQSGDKPDQQSQFGTCLVRDLLKIKPFIEENQPASIAPINSGHIDSSMYELVNTHARAQQILDSIDTGHSVVLDIETNYDKEAENSDPYGRILCIGIRYTPKHTGAATASLLSSATPDRKIAVFTDYAIRNLKWPQAGYIGHNFYGFDSVAMRQELGISLPTSGDTYIKSYVDDERTARGTHKLKTRARQNCGAGFYEDEREHEAGQNLYTYNANDVFYTDVLDDYLESQQDDDDRRLYRDLLLPAANMYSEAQYQGVRIDMHRLAEVASDLLNTKSKLEKQLQEEAFHLGYYSSLGECINLNSPVQIKQFLTKNKHLRIDNTEKATLETLNDQWVSDLLKYRRYEKAYTVYIKGVLAQVKQDGRAHPKCLIPGTRTGRPTYIDPPVNTLPHARTVGELSIVRAIFAADSSEHTLLEFDYDQEELWILWALTQDENLHEDLTSPWRGDKPDYHSKTCEEVLRGIVCETHFPGKNPSCPVCHKWAVDRDNQKHVNFGVAYRETAYGLTRPAPLGTGQDLQTCQLYIDSWYARNKKVYSWQRQVDEQIARDGVYVTPTGRKLRMPLVINKKQLRQGSNFPVQSIASDYTLISAIEIVKELPRLMARLLWTTYDSILIHSHKNTASEVEDYVRSVMTKPKFPDFPSIPVSVSQGDNLYDVSEVH